MGKISKKGKKKSEKKREFGDERQPENEICSEKNRGSKK